MIVLDRIRYRILTIDSLGIRPGVTSVIGPNGSGKTTLLKILSGIAVPDSGTVLVDGIPPRAREIGWVNEFPDRNLLFGNVADEIASPLRFRHLPCDEIATRVRDCMERLRIQSLDGRLMRDLSGGEKILVALAAALVILPEVLVLDEYDSHIDAHRAGEIDRILRSSSIPYIIRCTQQMETAATSDSVIVMENGRVTVSGKPDDVFTSPETPFYPHSWRCGVRS